jgi:hypothetical protein
MTKLVAIVACVVAVIACSNASPPSYLSGTHQVYYTVTVASGAFTANTLSVDLQTSPYGTTPTSISSLPLPYTSPTYSMAFTGAGAYLTATGSATASSGLVALTMSIWIDGVRKFTATTGIPAAMGAIATVTVQSPLI